MEEASISSESEEPVLQPKNEDMDKWISEINRDILALCVNKSHDLDGKLPVICIINGILSAYSTVVMETFEKDKREAFLDSNYEFLKRVLREKEII